MNVYIDIKPSVCILILKSANVITKCPQIDVHIIYTETCEKKFCEKNFRKLKNSKIGGNKFCKST